MAWIIESDTNLTSSSLPLWLRRLLYLKQFTLMTKMVTLPEAVYPYD